MIIGCVSLVFWQDKIVAMECQKGRGIILPGGKWEKGETFKETAARELREEVGLEAVSQKYVFGSMSTDGAYVNTFLTTIRRYEPKDSAEGKVRLATWEDLFTSDFKAYYQLLQDFGRHNGHF